MVKEVKRKEKAKRKRRRDRSKFESRIANSKLNRRKKDKLTRKGSRKKNGLKN